MSFAVYFYTEMYQNNSSIARAFPGGWVAHPESQSEEENEEILRKRTIKLIKI